MWMVHACMYVHVYYIHACSLVPTLLHQKTGREPGYEATCMLTGHNITPGYIAQPWWIGFRRLVDNIYTCQICMVISPFTKKKIYRGKVHLGIYS